MYVVFFLLFFMNVTINETNSLIKQNVWSKKKTHKKPLLFLTVFQDIPSFEHIIGEDGLTCFALLIGIHCQLGVIFFKFFFKFVNKMMKVLWTVMSGFIKLEVMEICNTGGEPLNVNTRNQEKKTPATAQ